MSLSWAEERAAITLLVIPEAAKASLSGAKTLKGPGPLRVVPRFAFTTADFKVEKLAFAETTSVMVFGEPSLSLSFLQEVKENARKKMAKVAMPVFDTNLLFICSNFND